MTVRWPEDLGVPRNIYRFGTFVLAIIVAVTALGAQMAYLQLMQAQTEKQIVSGESSVTQSVPSSRGLIYDAKHQLLVENLFNYMIEVVPHDLPLSEKPLVVRRLASLLNIDPVQIDEAIDSATGSLYTPIVVADGVQTDVARLIDENQDVLPGVHVVAAQVRKYPQGALFAEVLGYAGPLPGDPTADQKAAGYSTGDLVGKAGLELSQESELRGTYGQETAALDVNGQPIPGLVTEVSAPVPGESLTLSISVKEQQIATQALQWGLKQAGLKQGVLIAENPQTGEILAMVSLPSYNDDQFAQGISQADYQALANDPTGPLINKAVNEQYPPGSTYKLVTGTAGLQTGQITASSTIMSKPYVQVGTEQFPEWNGHGWGPLNIIMGLAHSSDTFFYQLTQKVGLTNLTDWARLYGFGDLTGVDLPGEVKGIVPDDNWKQLAKGATMFPGEVLQAGIGQGYDAATPLQLLNAYCALANGGNLMVPHVVASITDANGNVKPVAPQVIRQLPTSQQNLATMREATRAVVTSRHTYNLVDLPIQVAGKTGTAEFGERDRFGRLPYHEWFVGYTSGDPYHFNPSATDSQLAVLVFSWGANTLGDISTEIVKYYMALHYGLAGWRYPTNSNTPGHVRAILFKRTNFFGTANNH